MKISVVQENLNKALSIATRVIPSRPSLAVLSNVLLKTEASRLVLAATNLELAIVAKVGAKIETEGNVTVPGRLLAELVGSLNNDKLQLISADNNLRIKSTGVDSLLNGISADEFPVIPTIKAKAKLKIPAGQLAQALSEVVVASASDEARPVLNGVLFKLEGDSLILAATDSYRLAEAKVIVKADKAISVIVPVRAAQELIRLLANESGDATIELADNEIVFTVGETSLISRLIEGKYPDYAQIYPTDFKTQIVIDRQDLIKTVRVAALFARENANTIKLSVEKGNFLITSNASEVGENTSQITAKVRGDDMSIQLNARYLLDALNALPNSSVALELTGEINPCLIKPSAESKAKVTSWHIIMPLRS